MAGQKPSDSFHLEKTRRFFRHTIISEFARGSVIVSLIRDDADLSSIAPRNLGTEFGHERI